METYEVSISSSGDRYTINSRSFRFRCAIASGLTDCITAAAHMSKIPVNPRENKVRTVRFLLREKLILARERGVSRLVNFFVSPGFTASAVVILAASTGETDIAIRTGLCMDSRTVITMTKAVRTANFTVFGQYHPPGRSRYPIIQPQTIPKGIENNDIFRLSFCTRRFICFCVIPTTRRRPYSFTFSVTDM